MATEKFTALKSQHLLFLISTSFLIFLAAFFALQTYKQADREYFYLEWEKRGGVVGLIEFLRISSDGNWNLTRRVGDRSTSSSGRLTRDQLMQIRQLISDSDFLNLKEDIFMPMAGNFDYFSYRLKVIVDGKNKEVTWVDSWASSVPLPEKVLNLQKQIELLIAGELVA